jgi:micrococcal nuclease
MRLRLVVAVLALVLIAAPTLTAAPGPRGTLTGQVTFVRDGDTIVVGSMPIRLNGLAAPEWDEPGGDAAMDAMIKLVAGRTLRCELNGERTHDRCVGVCYLQGVDISAEMVRRGVARDCPRFSGGRYHVIEAQAAADGATIRQTYQLPAWEAVRMSSPEENFWIKMSVNEISTQAHFAVWHTLTCTKKLS